MKKSIKCLLIAVLLAVPVQAQETEVKITLNEQFFEALLEAVFTNLDEPSVPISLGASNIATEARARDALNAASFSLLPQTAFRYSELSTQYSSCDESVRLKREVEGVRTAVKFRRGGIIAPIAFEGNYNPPLIGCIGFSGWAETTIDLSFDKSKNAMIGNARVLKVNLTGTNGIGGSLITRLVQNSIDRKVNPLEIVKLDMLSFTAPVQKTGKLRMEAIGIRHEVRDQELDVFIKYRFGKADQR